MMKLNKRRAALGLMFVASAAHGFTPADPAPVVAMSWTGATLNVTASELGQGDLQVEVVFRVVHGSDDVTTVMGPLVLSPTSPVVVRPVWPDLASKGDELLAPATVAGEVRLLDGGGQTAAVYPVPRRLVFLDAPPETTYQPDELLTLVGPALDAAGFTLEAESDLSPEALVQVLDLAAAAAAGQVSP